MVLLLIDYFAEFLNLYLNIWLSISSYFFHFFVCFFYLTSTQMCCLQYFLISRCSSNMQRPSHKGWSLNRYLWPSKAAEPPFLSLNLQDDSFVILHLWSNNRISMYWLGQLLQCVDTLNFFYPNSDGVAWFQVLVLVLVPPF